MANEAYRLLVVDDDLVRNDVSTYLEAAGYIVDRATDQATALALFEQNEPDVVLVALRTTGFDGLAILKALGAHPFNTPIIVLSAASVTSDVVQALRYGASDYLIEPIGDRIVLEHAIERCLEQGRLRRENRRYRRKLEEANRELKERVSILQQDQQAGRHVQLKMLPATPVTFGRYQFSHRIFPSLYLSGDFVDYFTVGDRHVVFFIADVSGHGASSAFVTVLLKNLFARKRSDYSHRRDPSVLSPPAMLDRANRELLATEIGKYVTMCVLVLDTQSSQLRYSVAGHLPEPVLCADEGCRFLRGDSPPVGLYEDAEFREESLVLPERFTLTLFSDGVLEAVSGEGTLAREEALLNSLDTDLCSIEGVVDALGLGHTEEFPDDVAVLMITRGKG